jgi:hypothetical protein|eukprot:6490496-Prymnesium_polylepis.1
MNREERVDGRFAPQLAAVVDPGVVDLELVQPPLDNVGELAVEASSSVDLLRAGPAVVAADQNVLARRVSVFMFLKQPINSAVRLE